MKRGNIISLMTWMIGIALLVLIVAYLAGIFRTKVEPGKLPSPKTRPPSSKRSRPCAPRMKRWSKRLRERFPHCVSP